MGRSRVEEIEISLRERYGDLLGLDDLAGLLRYPSVGAVRAARLRGRLPVEVTKLPHRRGWYTTPRALAGVLARLEVSTCPMSACADGHPDAQAPSSVNAEDSLVQAGTRPARLRSTKTADPSGESHQSGARSSCGAVRRATSTNK
jgi:hypothetical protein